MSLSPLPRRTALLSLFVVGSAVLAACATVGVPKSVADILASDPELSTLHGLVKSAGLVQELSAPGPVTLFAPSNAAFKALPAKALEELARQPQALRDVLTYHVVPGTLKAADIKNGKVKTLQGGSVEVAKAGTFVTVESAAVTRADVVATNGVVHMVDAVLLPPKK